jgi:hypothetical protein
VSTDCWDLDKSIPVGITSTTAGVANAYTTIMVVISYPYPSSSSSDKWGERWAAKIAAAQQ